MYWSYIDAEELHMFQMIGKSVVPPIAAISKQQNICT